MREATTATKSSTLGNRGNRETGDRRDVPRKPAGEIPSTPLRAWDLFINGRGGGIRTRLPFSQKRLYINKLD